MNDDIQHDVTEPRADDADFADETEVLITRLIDDEATDDDRDRFAQLALMEPLAWRRLAMRQQDMLRLTSAFDEAIADAVAVELPEGAAPPAKARPRGIRLTMNLALAGWAAVVILSATWALTAALNERQQANLTDEQPRAGGQSLPTSDDYLGLYLQQGASSGTVVGELEPTMLTVTPLGDDLLQINFIRRLEEALVVPVEMAEEIFDDRGNFREDPGELRRRFGEDRFEKAERSQNPSEL